MRTKSTLFFITSFLFLVSFKDQKSKILIIGDSISIGYTPFVKKNLQEKAIVMHNTGNAKFTKNGIENLDSWLGDTKWDIIQFNWGLWDLCYRYPENSMDRNKIKGKVTTTKENYKANIEALVKRLEQTHAKLIFVTTSYVPEHEPGRFLKDASAYNAIAKQIMQKHGIMVNDIYKLSKKVHQKYGLGDDNVHYKAEGYQQLAVEICKGINKLLEN